MALRGRPQEQGNSKSRDLPPFRDPALIHPSQSRRTSPNEQIKDTRLLCVGHCDIS